MTFIVEFISYIFITIIYESFLVRILNFLVGAPRSTKSEMDKKALEEKYQYKVIELLIDLNPVIRKGIQGTILEVMDADTFLVEFLDGNGINVSFEDEVVFFVKKDDLRLISSA